MVDWARVSYSSWLSNCWSESDFAISKSFCSNNCLAEVISDSNTWILPLCSSICPWSASNNSSCSPCKNLFSWSTFWWACDISYNFADFTFTSSFSFTMLFSYDVNWSFKDKIVFYSYSTFSPILLYDSFRLLTCPSHSNCIFCNSLLPSS